MGSRRRVKATIRTQTAAYVVCTVSGTDGHNSQDRPRQSLATVWHHIHPYSLAPQACGAHLRFDRLEKSPL